MNEAMKATGFGADEFGAEASFEEHVKGRIAEGYLADFVILGADPFETEPAAIHEIPVLATYLGGRCVYSAED